MQDGWLNKRSDIRLKKNINILNCDKNEIYLMFDLIKVKSFNYLHNNLYKIYGLIAQDIEWNTILKECLLTINKDDGMYSLDYHNLGIINVLGIQQLIKDDNEMNIKINELNNRLITLKNTLEELESFLNL